MCPSKGSIEYLGVNGDEGNNLGHGGALLAVAMVGLSVRRGVMPRPLLGHLARPLFAPAQPFIFV